MLPRRAAVIGLGLMGGSLARDLAALGVEVRGLDRDPDTLRSARAEGVIRAELPPSLEGVEEADLVVLATPVAAAAAVLERLAPRLDPDCVVTDLGSTKHSIACAAAGLGLGERFVGSHPLTGSHRSGWEVSRRGLYAGARVFLCPTPCTAPETLERVRSLWLRLGALPELAEPEEHDRRLARTSHLPQILSSALARVLAGDGIPRGDLGPGGRDVTRLAGSSPEMWSAICRENRDHIDASVGALLDDLTAFRHALRSDDAAALDRFFATARAWAREDAASP